LTKCLQALSQLDFPRDQFEVIVVDDGSHIPLAPVIAMFADQLNLKLLRQANAGPAAARNYGAAQAAGTYLVFTDDDCAPHPQWLRSFAEQFADQSQCLLGGRTSNMLHNPYSAASQALIDILYEHFNQGGKAPTFFASNNMAMPRYLFQQVGGFSQAFPLSAGEDRDFCDQWLSHGLHMVYVPAAVILHAHQLTLHKFWRQHFNYGRGAVTYHRLREARGSGSFAIETNFHFNLRYWLIDPVRRTKAWYRWLMPALLVLSQVANLAGYLHQRRLATYPVEG
jgi:cellulose synthase/poly-beta-1,6-N-acetylglucosamine synthase-like glycosyltransferase